MSDMAVSIRREVAVVAPLEPAVEGDHSLCDEWQAIFEAPQVNVPAASLGLARDGVPGVFGGMRALTVSGGSSEQ
jgi:hypothetical protein